MAENHSGSQPQRPIQRQTAEISGEFVIELGDDKGRRVLFNPTGEILRGRWNRDILVGQTCANAPDLPTMPDIPGIHVALDATKKRGRILDPLNQPGNARILAEIQARYARVTRKQGGPEHDRTHPGKDSGRQTLSDSELKSWLYWMRNLVDGGKARVVSGSPDLPTLDAICDMPGKVDVGSPESSGYQKRYLEDIRADMVGVS